ncbi:MAG TPA: c-type cytochrome [Usitatibacter sp.]|nr:c-type cytochrome [Usitatibacter sp.]
MRAPHFRILAAAALAASALGAQAAGDANNARNKVFQCQGCHGIPGWKTAFPEVYQVPKLGGQNARYIVAALKEYKSGERDFATMRAIASTLSDQDMEDIAAYYGASAPSGATPAPAPQPEAAEKKK